MMCKDLLLQSLSTIRTKFPSYYDKLKNDFCNIDYDDIDLFLEKSFPSKQRAFFTISSKESFNDLISDSNWHPAIIFEPLNDHSRIYMHKGDIVFCYRQGQFEDLDDALNMRGIYGVGIVASEPERLYSDKEKDYQNYGVCILFPFTLSHHLELRNIQLNPITISLTPYNGNRNDALQYISNKKHYSELMKMVCNKNPEIREHFERFIGENYKNELLPIDFWNKDKLLMNDSSSRPSYTSNFSQIIYYGVPGSGKSHKIDKKLQAKIPNKEEREQQSMRVVFHPEYTNADFVGQILPVQAPDGIAYLFKAGPFSRILKRALKNPDKPYYLIIEEINRGNAAAIFGDLFQLLDRNSDGWSSYSIENMDINAFIRSSDDKYSDKNAPSNVQVGNLTFTENTSIRLPPNLSLFATMNTSDQNVFTLDNAFQRRWDMKLVENKFEGEDAENQRNAKIGGTEVTWENFQTFINKKISEISSSVGMSSMEDKRLGCWFVKETDGKISKEKFAEKVLKYLWDDAFKFNHDDIFNIQENASFESIVEKFKGKENESCDWSIFKDTSFVQSANEQ